MDSEENMLRNAEAIREVNPTAITWVYRNGIKALVRRHGRGAVVSAGCAVVCGV